MTEILGNQKVDKVVVSKRLGTSPCMVVTSKFGWSANMERIMSTQAMGDSKSLEYMKGRKIMEINPDAPIIKAMLEKCGDPDEQAVDLCELLYETGLLTSGFTVEEPTSFAGRIFALMNVSANVPADTETSNEVEETKKQVSDVVEPEIMKPENKDEIWG